MTALERAARALALEAGHDHPTIHHIRQVRAVLLAVREPDADVLQAGEAGAAHYAHDVEEYASPAMVCGAFTAMIDAILTEPDVNLS